MTRLALILKTRGHSFHQLCYHTHDFFKPEYDAAGIPVEVLQTRKSARPLASHRAIQRVNPDVVISFLNGPNLYAELARLINHKFILIVSERKGFPGKIPYKEWPRLQMHRLADFVVMNSPDLQDKVNAAVPALRHKTRVIFNCVDLEKFQPEPLPPTEPIKILVLARFTIEKNLKGVYEAFKQLDPLKTRVELDWHGFNYFENGQPTRLSQLYLELQERITNDGATDRFRLHEPSSDVSALYHNADVVLLASFYEGCSNVLCEALACGKPLLASDVCSNDLLVKSGHNGFLFDPHQPGDIAAKIQAFATLTQSQRDQMGEASRARAKELLDPDVFADQWLELIEQAKSKRGITHAN